jgi:stress-induced morphogen
MVQAADVESALRSKLQATDVEVIDTSGGYAVPELFDLIILKISFQSSHRPTASLVCSCGSAFEVYIVAAAFEGKRLLQRHQLVNRALSDLMPEIHALSIKRTKTPEEMKTASAS